MKSRKRHVAAHGFAAKARDNLVFSGSSQRDAPDCRCGEAGISTQQIRHAAEGVPIEAPSYQWNAVTIYKLQ
jgi:hypothetical protein